MCLENKIVELTVAIAKLTESLSNGAVGEPTGSKQADKKTAAADKKTAAADKKTAAADKKTAAADKKTTTTAAPTHTLAELKAALQDYKAIFGTPTAKKLLPSMGFANSAAVTDDKLDEVYDAIIAKIEAEASEGATEESDDDL